MRIWCKLKQIVPVLTLAALLLLCLSLAGCTEKSNNTTPAADHTGQTTHDEQTQKPSDEPCTVTFDADGGSPVAAQTVQKGEKVAKPTDPEKPGYFLSGWLCQGEEWSFTDRTVTGDVTLTAKWEPISYTVTYQLDGGTNAPDNPATFTVESNTLTLTAPERAGYTFTGWTWPGQTAPQLTATIPAGTRQDQSFTANWQLNTYTVAYVLNDGTVAGENPTAYTVESDTVTLIAPTRKKYVFAGWTWEGQTEPQPIVTLPGGLYGDKTFVANWAPETSVLTFDANGGTVSPASMTATYNTECTLPTPERTGYTFEGWYGNSRCFTSGIWTYTGDKTLTARWTANTYTVAFDANGSTVSPTSQQFTFDAVCTLPTPTWRGYTFLGWFSGSTRVEDGIWRYTDVQTLTAQWSPHDPLSWQDYGVVYYRSASDVLQNAVEDLLMQLERRTGSPAEYLTTDAPGTLSNDEIEILIGETDRDETAAVKMRISGDGWCIVPINCKIVIYGTDDYLTILAIQRFIDTYLFGTDAEPANVRERIRSDCAMTEISAAVQLVHPSGLDDVKNSSDRSPYYDYPIVGARALRATLAGICGTAEEAFSLQRDSAAYAANELAVGLTGRPVTRQLLAKLGNVDRYGFLIRDGQIAVAGYNDVTLKLALELFADYCRNADKRDNGDGTYTVLLPDGLYVIRTYTAGGWVTDFPLPSFSGLTLTGSVDVGSGFVEYYYTGSGVNQTNFEDYCAILSQSGYQLYTSNNIENNLYRTYYDAENNVSIYLSYTVFAYAAEQNVTRWEPCIRIVSSPIGDTPLTESRLLESDMFKRNTTFRSYTKITDTKITAMQLNRSLSGMNGSSFIITLEDGSFFIIDGGIDPRYTKAYNPATGKYDLPVTSTGDEDRLYNILCDLYYITHGVEPDGSEHRIRIAGWYITHYHEDHAGNLLMFAPKYGSLIDADYLIGTAPSVTEYANSYNPTPLYINEIPTICNSFSTPMAYCKVHTGWKFYLRNMELEVLLTHEDLYPQRINMFNDSSTIIRTTIYNTNGSGIPQGTPTTILWLGDLETKGSQFLRASYGSYLRSDMCQVSHHGGNGCEWALYQLVAPRCLLWPNSYSFVRQYFRDDTYSSGYSVIDRHLIHDLPTLEYVIVCDKQNVTVTITKNGPQFALDQLYNAMENDTNPVTQYASLDVAGGIFRVTH